jgi:hypothetical protein
MGLITMVYTQCNTFSLSPHVFPNVPLEVQKAVHPCLLPYLAGYFKSACQKLVQVT